MGETLRDPLAATVPSEVMLTVSAFVTLHCKVELCPALIDGGVAVKLAITGSAAATVTVMLQALVFPAPVAVMMYKVVCVGVTGYVPVLATGPMPGEMLTVSAFNSPAGTQAVEIVGRLIAQQEHLGFGQYVATDRSLRFHQGVQLPNGEIMLDDFTGTGSIWTVTRDGSFAWVTKNQGTPDLVNGSYVQMIRAFGGRFSIKRSPGY